MRASPHELIRERNSGIAKHRGSDVECSAGAAAAARPGCGRDSGDQRNPDRLLVDRAVDAVEAVLAETLAMIEVTTTSVRREAQAAQVREEISRSRQA